MTDNFEAYIDFADQDEKFEVGDFSENHFILEFLQNKKIIHFQRVDISKFGEKSKKLTIKPENSVIIEFKCYIKLDPKSDFEAENTYKFTADQNEIIQIARDSEISQDFYEDGYFDPYSYQDDTYNQKYGQNEPSGAQNCEKAPQIQPESVEAHSIEEMAKQRYLVSEIINKGYDQQQFCAFLTNHRKNEDSALDINQWSFDELSDVVLAFQENGGSAEPIEGEWAENDDEWEDLDGQEVEESRKSAVKNEQKASFSIFSTEKEVKNASFMVKVLN